MNAYRANLFSGGSFTGSTHTIDLGSTKRFFAWCQVNLIDSLNDFDRDNAVAIEVYMIDGARTVWQVSGGDHFGADNTSQNVHQGALSGYGRRVTFRIRAMHGDDLAVYGTGIVLVP